MREGEGGPRDGCKQRRPTGARARRRKDRPNGRSALARGRQGDRRRRRGECLQARQRTCRIRPPARLAGPWRGVVEPRQRKGHLGEAPLGVVGEPTQGPGRPAEAQRTHRSSAVTNSQVAGLRAAIDHVVDERRDVAPFPAHRRYLSPLSMAIENVALLAIENVTLRGLTCGGSGATGAGEPAKSLVTLMRPALGKQDVQYVFGLRSDGSPLRARRGGASGSCCPGC